MSRVRRPNIFFIITDQQRYDTIAAHGFPHMVTPNLDTLAARGKSYLSCFTAGATCVVARAALFTGMFAHNTGVYSFNNWSHHRSWVQDLKDAGYHTANIGKMHVMPFFEKQAFDERVVVENPTTNFAASGGPDDSWGRHLAMHGVERPLDRHRSDPAWHCRHQGVAWEMPEHLHSDVFIGDEALGFIGRWKGEKPLFLQIGFTGPHEPYDPLPRHLSLYEHRSIPLPELRPGDLEGKPRQHRIHGEFNAAYDHESTIDLTGASLEELANMRRHYYANVTTIDEKIGHILEALKSAGLLEDAVVLFTSDHGDMLGEHRLPYKWLMYDSITRVPLIIWDTVNPAGGKYADQLVSQIDIGPGLLDLAGVPRPAYLEGRPIFAEQEPAEEVFSEDNYLTMVRTRRWKYVHYTFEEATGELYNVEADPNELSNLFGNPSYADQVADMQSRLLKWITRSAYRTSVYRNRAGAHHPVWPLMPEDGGYLHHRAKSQPDRWSVAMRAAAGADEPKPDTSPVPGTELEQPQQRSRNES